jgi:periplasmic divalent cation tolerance protein
MAEYIVIFITAPQEEVGARIAKALVEEKLAGCVNIIKDIRSIYFWQDKVEDEPEVLLVIKTKKSLFERLKERVKTLHPYSVPEVIAIPIIEGSEDYLRWLDEVLVPK